jgi:hypothetical protein
LSKLSAGQRSPASGDLHPPKSPSEVTSHFGRIALLTYTLTRPFSFNSAAVKGAFFF